MLFIFFDPSSLLSYLILATLIVAVIIFRAQLIKTFLYLSALPLIVYCIIRWVVLKVLEAYGLVEEKPRKVVDIKGMPDLEMALVISLMVALALVFLANKACS